MITRTYRFILAPLMTLGVFFVSPFHHKLRASLLQKIRRGQRPQFSEPPIWIHAASGEFEYAKPVIREIKSREPNTPIVVTYSSPSFAESVSKFPGVDYARPLPLDLPGPMRSFLRLTKPKCLLISRTDLWPEMLYQAKRFDLPIILFAYTQKDPSRMPWLARKIRTWLLKQIDLVQCVSLEDKENLKSLGIQTGFVLGDPRFDQVAYRLKNPKALPSSLKPTRPTLVAGSTWPDDERVLLDGLDSLLKAHRCQLILVPHEPTSEHIEALSQWLKAKDISFSTYSKGSFDSAHDVLIVDEVGVLAELYAWGDFAFVGGSFKGSVHSVMEPLGAHLLTLVGPHFANNREALEFCKIPVGPFMAVQKCSDGDSLNRTVSLLIDQKKEERKPAIEKAFNERLGASRRIYDTLFTGAPAGPSDDPGLSLRN